MDLCIQSTISLRRGFPIRTSADQRSLASPRGFSQRATSFIASWRQGIHRTPFSRSRTHPPPPARRTKPRQMIAHPRPPATHVRTAPALLLPQPTSHTHSDEPSHPTQSAELGPSRQRRTIRPPNPIHRLKEHAQHQTTKARGRKLCEGSRRPPNPTGTQQPQLRMEASGFEPLTPCLQSRCSTS